MSRRDPLVVALGERLAVLSREAAVTRLCVALSGGPDSVALLAALVILRRSSARWRALPLRALHVDHQLQPASAGWARRCRGLGRALGVPVTVRRVEVRRGKGLSLEAEARRARRAAFAAALRPDEALLTAHHLEDQLETMLLMLMRGAGVDGLAAMPPVMRCGAGWMLRPLLGATREELAAFVARRRLPVVDDESNSDERFDRNYLRRRVTPLLRARWPAAAKVAARSASRLGEARQLLADLAQADLAQCCPVQAGPLRAVASAVDGALPTAAALHITCLSALSAARQRNALRAWLRGQGASMPDAVHLERIRVELPAARADAQPAVHWPGGEVRRFRGRLYFLAIGAAPRATLDGTDARTGNRWDWARGRHYPLGPGRGRLRLVPDPSGPIARASLPSRLEVRTRLPGARVALRAAGPRHGLGELMREAGVLPWERDRLPVVCADARIVAVPGLLVSAAFAAPSASAMGSGGGRAGRLRLVWEDAPPVLAAR
ncbi:MAG: tRNA lysidine(34) synthetase TilS [Gammaproteobacteria bacterium]